MSLSEQVAALKLTSRKGGPDVRRLLAAFQTAFENADLPPPSKTEFVKPQVRLCWTATRYVVLWIHATFRVMVDTGKDMASRHWEPGHRFHPDFEWGVYHATFAESEVDAVVLTLQQLLCPFPASNPQEQLSAFMRNNACCVALWPRVRDLLQTAHVGSPKRWSVDIVDGKGTVVLRWPRTRLVVTDDGVIRIAAPRVTWQDKFVSSTPALSTHSFIVEHLRSELRNDELPALTHQQMLSEFWAKMA